MNDEFTFDKFVDEIILKERQQQKRDINDEELSDVRKYYNSRRENPTRLIKFNK